jgi:hypothetical protein
VGTVRLTMAQALVRFLANQHVERDGVEQHLFAGCFGIFGHGNVAGVGQALQQYSGDLTYYQARNEQAMVHTASAYARMKNRLQTLACTSSIGPGATNMLTGAALATINRLPVLLLPGDVFASRRPDPVLQQLEAPHDGDLSVNDCFRPVSKYWDRLNRAARGACGSTESRTLHLAPRCADEHRVLRATSACSSAKPGFWLIREGRQQLRPFLLPLFTEVPGRRNLRTSPCQIQAKFRELRFQALR